MTTGRRAPPARRGRARRPVEHRGAVVGASRLLEHPGAPRRTRAPSWTARRTAASTRSRAACEDQRADVGGRIGRVPDAEPGDALEQTVAHRSMTDSSTRIRLPAVHSARRPRTGLEQVVEQPVVETGRVGEDDLGALAAHLQADPLEVAGGRGGQHPAPRRGAAGERQRVHPVVVRQGRAGDGSRPGTTCSAPGGRPASWARSARRRALRGVASAGLEDQRAAGRERGPHLPGRHGQREVPRQDRRADTDGLAQGQVQVVLGPGRSGGGGQLVGRLGEVPEALDRPGRSPSRSSRRGRPLSSESSDASSSACCSTRSARRSSTAIRRAAAPGARCPRRGPVAPRRRRGRRRPGRRRPPPGPDARGRVGEPAGAAVRGDVPAVDDGGAHATSSGRPSTGVPPRGPRAGAGSPPSRPRPRPRRRAAGRAAGWARSWPDGPGVTARRAGRPPGEGGRAARPRRAPTSAGVCGGVWNCRALPPSTASRASIGVSVADGSTDETRMPSWRRSSAIESMAPRRPNFEAQ